MGKMENVTPEALAGATGAGNREQAFTPAQYRLDKERAITLKLAIADCPPEVAAPILWEAQDHFHRQGLTEAPAENLMGHATAWAETLNEREQKAYSVALARRMDPSTREAFRLYLAGGK